MGKDLRATDIRTRHDETDEESVAIAALARLRVGTDSVVVGEEESGAVGTSLIPALDSGTDGAGGDGEEQPHGHVPLVVDLVVESVHLLLGELLLAVDQVGLGGVLGDERSLLEDREVLGELMVGAPGLDVVHQLRPGDALERVADLGLEVVGQVDLVEVRHAALLEVFLLADRLGVGAVRWLATRVCSGGGGAATGKKGRERLT